MGSSMLDPGARQVVVIKTKSCQYHYLFFKKETLDI